MSFHMRRLLIFPQKGRIHLEFGYVKKCQWFESDFLLAASGLSQKLSMKFKIPPIGDLLWPPSKYVLG